MSEIQIGDFTYRCGRMPTRVQFHVVKRLIPVLQGLAPLFGGDNQNLIPGPDGTYQSQPNDVSVFQALSALSNTLGMMPDADADYVLNAALAVVAWRQGDRWVPLMIQGGGLTNGSADSLDVQLRLLWEVLVESLGNFSLETLLPRTLPNGQDQTAQMVGRPG